ncbi:hypothetical protein COEREDRAFT_7239 [Coemansia reversa NRRL 1564]|uniref:N-acetyltransferase domain-containing protein n=1 Tax=Coemansia reversa (strain ATCC 12441 / NRRL 1564) TaxID=763665 RepID=A0A2G5BF45_COERN|nr:hypothetical protein COEREDRAFT_7239 [Coemansia reversa NRRL 1564]|eukprot:PIA17646.1 hypothetical protein COEREDRAFT_7239 [Coemansia reversa NRRL 1564]
MTNKFKYDLEALEWDDAHKRNKEGTYCYCAMNYGEGDSMLRCEGCEQLFHWDCVSCLKTKPLLGDPFYRFKCSVCNSGREEEYERETLSWVQVIYIVLYHLARKEPEKKYFRWRENICATINEHWEGLFPSKTKTATWHNTVAGCLSTHGALFKSGFDETQQTGNWTLHEIVEPSRERFKGPTKARDSAKPVKRERQRKRANDNIEHASGAEKEILEILNEGKVSNSKHQGARHRVSFSDDENEDEAPRKRSKRRGLEARGLANDTELWQSFELFSKLERQRLDHESATNGSEDALEKTNTNDDAVPLSAAATAVEEEQPISTKSGTSDGIAGDIFDDCSSLSSWSSEDIDIKLEDPTVAMDIVLTDKRKLDTLDATDQPLGQEAVKLQPKSNLCEVDSSDARTSEISVEPDSQRMDVDTDKLVDSVDTCVEPGANNDITEPSLKDNVDAQKLMFVDEDLDTTPLPIMSAREQWDVSERIGSSHVAMESHVARRLRRRLQLRRLKGLLGLRVFDIDRAVEGYMKRQQQLWKHWDLDYETGSGGSNYEAKYVQPAVLDDVEAPGVGRQLNLTQDAVAPTNKSTARQSNAQATELAPELKVTAYANSFASRLLGRALLRDSLTTTEARISPFHGRLLRPFIWRDHKLMKKSSETTQRISMPMLHTLRAIRARKHAVFQAHGLECAVLPDYETIDYVYFQSEHVQQVNSLLCRTLWPGIDVSEALQYPEFSIVALYGRQVVGCAFLTPDAYLTYIAVASGWEGAGIAKYMVYHLTQTVPTKDVTLHVAATNLAMLLYQQLGFKPETYNVGFYKSYLPSNSQICPNAFFMRLRRY